MFIEYNPNPSRKLVDDCVIRAICKLTGQSWDAVYTELMILGMQFHDWPVKNYIWGRYLKDLGFDRTALPDTCPDCYTVKDFCKDYPYGDYILALDGHVVAVSNGDYYDTWDSGDEVPLYYWKRR